jgi:Rab guanine nucleotide exchange factor SEC2
LLTYHDSDPTIRLDLAPSLNWLTRRSVLAAIHSGQLNIEPMATSTLLEELNAHSNSGLAPSTHATCALCGANIVEYSSSSATSPSSLPHSPTRAGSFGKTGWGSSFLKSSLQTISNTPFSQHSTQAAHSKPPFEPPSQVYIFRLESTASTGLPVSLPLASQQNGAQTRTATIYPLCTSGWCLTRLRTTCSLWAFIRISVVEKIWEDEPFVPPPAADSLSVSSPDATDRPATPAKKVRMGIGALWGSMSRSVSTNASEKSPTADAPKAKEVPTPAEQPKRRLPPPPPPPPQRPSLTGPAAVPPPPPPRRHPPKETNSSLDSHVAAPVPVRPPAVVPPPLPKRNRQRTESPAPPHDSHTEEKAPVLDGEAPATVTTPSPPEQHIEEFKTPETELPEPPLVDLVTAASVPLPPSAPATPVAAVFPPSHPPSRTASPAPELVAVSAHPVPPPLPRRAAARARPSSMATNPPITAPAPEPEEVISEPKVEGAQQPNVDGKAEKETAPAAQLSAPTAEDKADGAETENASEPTAVSETIIKSEETPHGRVLEPRDGENLASPVQETMEHTDSEQVSEGVMDQKTSELDTRMYVGTSTWEERTWRELIKLREDMFWARAGGVR